MKDQAFYILLIILGAICILGPFIIAWRIKFLGTAVTTKGPAGGVEPTFTSWVTVKGRTKATRQSMLCRMMLYQDRIGLRFLWGTARYIPFSAVGSIEVLMRGQRAVAFVLKPKDPEALCDTTFSGIAELETLTDKLKGQGIDVKNVPDSRGITNFLR